MRVVFDLKKLRIDSMDNATLNIGKNWIVTVKKKEHEKRGEKKRVEPLGGGSASGNARAGARTREPCDP